MKNKLIHLLSTLVIVLILANCVRETDFFQSNADQNALVADGTFTDGPGPHIIRLTRPGDSNKQAFEPVRNAQITLSDDAGNQFNYQEMVSPDGIRWFYQLNNVRGVPGRSYTLQILLPDGQTYRSRPEKMPAKVLLDSASVKGEFLISNNADGSIGKEPFAYVYAHTTVSATGLYLRWEAETVHIFNEIVKSYYPIPPPQKQCFITNRLSDQQVSLVDLSDYQPGASIYEYVGKRRIDNAFEHRICFAVYQHSITRSVYEYWQKISQLISPTGTIFDVPPSRIYGNVENTTHPDHPAFGYFQVSAVDTARVYTSNGLLGDDFLLSQTTYCDYDYSGKWPPVNHPECDDCLLLPSSTLQQPVWWQ